MPLAFCILAHKNPKQLRHLVEALCSYRSTIIIHYDKRRPDRERDKVKKIAHENPQVSILPPRKVNWGRWSQMQAQLDMMSQALEIDDSWTHLLTISGQDFPLISVERISAILTRNPDTSMIEWFDPFEAGRWKDAQERITRWHFDSDELHRFLRLPGIGRRIARLMGWQHRIPFFPCVHRRMPDSFQWYGGSNHHNLARDAVSYVVHDAKARLIGHRLRRAAFPEESFIQSALLNSNFANTLQNTDRRAIFWDRNDSPSPKILKSSDLPALREAREKGAFFARKFDTETDASVLLQLADELSS
jgi:hypothetical protein